MSMIIKNIDNILMEEDSIEQEGHCNTVPFLVIVEEPDLFNKPSYYSLGIYLSLSLFCIYSRHQKLRS